MREIKFRAWDKEQKHMFTWKEILEDFEISDLIEGEGGTKNTEVMQYTGLKDKNGKEIYEGDIVYIDASPYASGHNLRYSVEYAICGFRLNSLDSKFKRKILKNTMKFAQIIGNIYEDNLS